MLNTKRWIITVFTGALLLLMSGIASAQEILTGELLLGQPAIFQIEPASLVQNHYVVNQPSMVTLQALSQGAPPTLSILRNGAVIAEEMNTAGQPIVTLAQLLDAGEYMVETGVSNAAASSTIMLVVQNETPVTVTPLAAGTSLGGEVSSTTPIELFSFSALAEPAYLFIDSVQPESGVRARLLETAGGTEIAVLDSMLAGARLSIPAGSLNYQLEIGHSGSANSEAFNLCLVAVGAGSCGTTTPVVAEVPADDTCRVMANSASGVNLRQTASTSAPILMLIPSGESVLVSGITADGSFYNVVYGAWSGWVAAIAVTPSGNCSGLAVLSAPPLPATATPVPSTPMPIPPTAVPTQPPAPTPTQDLGPCHVVFSAEEFVYTQPEADSMYLFDQVVATGEIIPVGRWSQDPSWWKTNYGGWWLNALGTAGEVRGDCSNLPLVSWP